MASLADRVKESTLTTGTGTYVLGGTSDGYQTFASAFADGTKVLYVVHDDTDWETGLGTYSANTLARTVVSESSNADAAVNWAAGTKQVFVAVISGYNKLVSQKHNDIATTNPGVSNDTATGYAALSLWLNTTSKHLWHCVSNAVGAAVWRRFVTTNDTHTITGTDAECVGGTNCTAAGDSSLAGGQYASAQHSNGFVRGVNRSGSTAGMHQSETVMGCVQTTNGTTTRVALGATSPTRLTMPANSMWTLETHVTAYNNAGNEGMGFILRAVYRRNASGDPVLVGSPPSTVDVGHDGSLAWTAAYAIDTTNDAIDINVTGEAAKTINWTATTFITQATF